MENNFNNFRSMEQQARSLPLMLDKVLSNYSSTANQLIKESNLSEKENIIIFGSGDSNFVGLTSEFAFRAFTRTSVEVMTSLKFSRYISALIPEMKREDYVAIGISVSGSSSRTREGIVAAQNNRIDTVSLTSSHNEFSALAKNGYVIELPEFPDPEPHGTPGVRSFFANHLALLLLSIQMGLGKNTLSEENALRLMEEIKSVTSGLINFIDENADTMNAIIRNWADHNEYVFVGAGSNYGMALFGAAKFIEATGDFAMAQETEEWAHLNYYNRKTNTPTIIISSGKKDYSRTKEIIAAAKKIGRKTLLVSSGNHDLASLVDFSLAVPDCDENVVPLYFSAVFSFLASIRAEMVNATYFRQNNSVETSKIRSSEMA